METFFQFFEKRTGHPPSEAKLIVQIISGYLAKNYKKEFALFIQYFLTQNFDKQIDTTIEGQAKNLNV